MNSGVWGGDAQASGTFTWEVQSFSTNPQNNSVAINVFTGYSAANTAEKLALEWNQVRNGITAEVHGDSVVFIGRPVAAIRVNGVQLGASDITVVQGLSVHGV